MRCEHFPPKPLILNERDKKLNVFVIYITNTPSWAFLLDSSPTFLLIGRSPSEQYAGETPSLQNLGRGNSVMAQSANPNTGIDSPRAWLIVLAAFFGAFVVFGVTYSFGAFLRHVATAFGASHASMSALFATMTVLSQFVAPFTGELVDSTHDFRWPAYVAAISAVLALGAVMKMRAEVPLVTSQPEAATAD